MSTNIYKSAKRRKLNDGSAVALCETKDTSVVVSSLEEERGEFWTAQSVSLEAVNDWSAVGCFHFECPIVARKFAHSSEELHAADFKWSNELRLRLQRETDNAKDANACAIWCDFKLGYTSQGFAKPIAQLLDSNFAEIRCESGSKQWTVRLTVRIFAEVCATKCLNDEVMHCLFAIQSQTRGLRAAKHLSAISGDTHVTALVQMATVVLDRYSHVLATGEQKLLQTVASVIGQSNNDAFAESHCFAQDSSAKSSECSVALNGSAEVSVSALHLLSRLCQRKKDWFKVDALNYDALADCKGAIEWLSECGLVVESATDDGIDSTLLGCLTLAEIKEVCAQCGLRIGSKASRIANKAQSVTSILKQLTSQKTVFGKALCESPRFLKTWNVAIGHWLKLSAEWKQTYAKCCYLFYLNRDDSVQSEVRQSIGQLQYAAYTIDSASLFPNKACFDQFYAALTLLTQFEIAVEKTVQTESDSQFIVNTIETSAKKLSQFRVIDLDSDSDSDFDESDDMKSIEEHSAEPRFTFRFREAHAFGRILHIGAKHLAESHEFEGCVRLYRLLIDTQSHSFRRGKWFTRLALVLDYHLKLDRRALAVCSEGIADVYVDTGDRNALEKRSAKLRKRLGIGSPLKMKDLEEDEKGEALEIEAIKEEVFEAMPIASETGRKLLFHSIAEDLEETPVSVEELALQFFAKPENGGWNGIHCEGSLFGMIFGVLFWDVIFLEAPLVFQSPCQSAPLDWSTAFFYDSRKAQIKDRCKVIAAGTCEWMEAEIRRVFAHCFGQSCVGVHWDKWRLNELVAMCQCIGGLAISKACSKLAENHYYWKAGLPDLFLWKAAERKCYFVEVKSQRDRLSEKQTAWLFFLRDVAMCQVCVCKIKEPK